MMMKFVKPLFMVGLCFLVSSQLAAMQRTLPATMPGTPPRSTGKSFVGVCDQSPNAVTGVVSPGNRGRSYSDDSSKRCSGAFKKVNRRSSGDSQVLAQQYAFGSMFEDVTILAPCREFISSIKEARGSSQKDFARRYGSIIEDIKNFMTRIETIDIDASVVSTEFLVHAEQDLRALGLELSNVGINRYIYITLQDINADLATAIKCSYRRQENLNEVITQLEHLAS